MALSSRLSKKRRLPMPVVLSTKALLRMKLSKRLRSLAGVGQLGQQMGEA